MTHDELLAKIDSDIAKTDAVVGLQFCRPTLKALRAIVELHKPSLGGACSHCSTTTFWTAYPCPTIQAIEEQLK